MDVKSPPNTICSTKGLPGVLRLKVVAGLSSFPRRTQRQQNRCPTVAAVAGLGELLAMVVSLADEGHATPRLRTLALHLAQYAELATADRRLCRKTR